MQSRQTLGWKTVSLAVVLAWAVELPALAAAPAREAKKAPAEKILPVTHHGQITQVWCWAAAIAMVAEFLNHQHVDDCMVASKLDRANGGSGVCCDTREGFIDERCVYGRKWSEMTDVMKWDFRLTPTELHRPLKWDELKSSIDAGYPLIASFWWGGRMGHAVVIIGYREPDTVYIDDPWLENLSHPIAQQYSRMVGRRSRYWFGTWYFRQDELSGHFSGASTAPEKLGPQLPKSTRPATASVETNFPALTDAGARKVVQQRASEWADNVRDCYEDALTRTPAPPSPARMRLTFAVEKGSPAWIVVKDAGGLAPSVASCVSSAFSRWAGLFPTGGNYADSQQLEITFARLAPPAVSAAPATAPAPPTAATQVTGTSPKTP